MADTVKVTIRLERNHDRLEEARKAADVPMNVEGMEYKDIVLIF
jgi:hypothetical protein